MIPLIVSIVVVILCVALACKLCTFNNKDNIRYEFEDVEVGSEDPVENGARDIVNRPAVSITRPQNANKPAKGSCGNEFIYAKDNTKFKEAVGQQIKCTRVPLSAVHTKGNIENHKNARAIKENQTVTVTGKQHPYPQHRGKRKKVDGKNNQNNEEESSGRKTQNLKQAQIPFTSDKKEDKSVESAEDSTPLKVKAETNVVSNNTLKSIVIDGSNVGMEHAKEKLGHQGPPSKGKLLLSSEGIEICVKYFQLRGHKDIKVVLPQYRLKHNMSDNPSILWKLKKDGILKTIPEKSHDDYWILQYAFTDNAVIISNDKYRQEIGNYPEFKDVVEKGRLGFRWNGIETLMFPPDPRGRNRKTGIPFITLDDFLLA